MDVRRLAATVVLGGVTAACGVAAPGERSSRPAPVGTATAAARPVAPDPRVGALFLGAGAAHTCTAAVLDSTGRDLILTAAHCLVDGVDATFVPGFSNQASAGQAWHLDAVYLDPRWVANQDPVADFAVARVSRDGGGSLEPQSGAGLVLGTAPQPGTVVTVTGYGSGEGGDPIGCRAQTELTAGGFPSLACAGLVDGVSGSPWIIGSTVTGLVGGLDGGGCDDDISYSPPFDGAIARLLARAEEGGAGDAAPAASGGDC